MRIVIHDAEHEPKNKAKDDNAKKDGIILFSVIVLIKLLQLTVFVTLSTFCHKVCANRCCLNTQYRCTVHLIKLFFIFIFNNSALYKPKAT